MPRLRTWSRPLLGAACALLSLPVGTASAQEPTAVAAAAPAVRPALWKIADEDTTIWLFGTIHVLPEDVRWYAGPVASAFDSAQELVTEIPIDEAGDSQNVLVNKSTREDGKTLRETLSPEQRQAYESAMTAIGMPAQALDNSDTWFAALLLTLVPLHKAGYSIESGIDAQVSARAKARHMANFAFETAEYQIGLFDNLPQETQRTYLNEVIKALPTVRSDIDAMVAAWKSGDAEHLARLLNEDENDPQMRKVLITDRNVAWAKWLKARLDKPGMVFVAVGAGHLAGIGSVQDQLAASGIVSSRVQ